ncbi:hypothetical protein CapIbe_010728 [Capra ibex]
MLGAPALRAPASNVSTHARTSTHADSPLCGQQSPTSFRFSPACRRVLCPGRSAPSSGLRMSLGKVTREQDRLAGPQPRRSWVSHQAFCLRAELGLCYRIRMCIEGLSFYPAGNPSLLKRVIIISSLNVRLMKAKAGFFMPVTAFSKYKELKKKI